MALQLPGLADIENSGELILLGWEQQKEEVWPDQKDLLVRKGGGSDGIYGALDLWDEGEIATDEDRATEAQKKESQ